MLTIDDDFCSGVLVLCGADLSSAAVHTFILHSDVLQHQSTADHSDLRRIVSFFYNVLTAILDTKKAP